jgi:hypothetical protein
MPAESFMVALARQGTALPQGSGAALYSRKDPFMTLSRSCLSLCMVATLVACSSESNETGGSHNPAGTGGNDGGAPPPGELSWTRLIEGDWTLDAGAEVPELCVKKEITEDLYISAIRPIHPFGTHHTLLSQSDGSTGCNASLRANSLIYAAGVGSEGLVLPPGVAMKLEAGTVLGLGLHLYNPSTEAITGNSGMEVVLADPDEIEHLAEAVLVGPFNVSVPPGEHTLTGECVLPEEQTVFASFPHMHQLGTHFQASFVVGGQEQVFHDAPYDFEEQLQIPLAEPMHLSAGDSMVTTCTWQNPTGQTVGFGESSDREMCFNIVFQYPARGSGFCGASGGRPNLGGPACAAEGDPGNELGVGAYCVRGGDTCGSGLICLADFVDGDIGNFCSSPCSSDADCGTGAACVGDARTVCFPTTCAENLGLSGG